MKKYFLLCAAMLLATGCTLDEVREQGKTCPPKGEEGVLSYIHTSECTIDNCNDGDFTDNFTRGVCPIQYPACAKDDDDLYYCTTIVCEKGKHVHNGRCEDDNLDNCGAHGNACSSEAGWDGGDCTAGKCVATACTQGYNLEGGKCKAMTKCEDENTHYYEGICEPDSLEHCGSHDKACSSEVGWEKGTCEAGKCVASDCTQGYTLDGGKCKAMTKCEDENTHYYEGICEPDTPEHCGSHNTDCTRQDGWKAGECINSECVAMDCEEGYTLKNGRCDAIINCSYGKHYFAGDCEDDSLDNCGSHGQVCAKKSGWVNGDCFNGECVVSECSSGYTIKDGQCVAITECDAGKHYFDGDCENDTPENCGSHGKSCSENIGWVNGTCTEGNCVATECEDIYEIEDGKCTPRTSCSNPKQHLYANICEDDTLENCLSHGYDCNLVTGWKSGTCEATGCVPSECVVGYHLDNGTCVLDTTAACGPQAIACEPGQVCSEGQCKDNCNAGEYRCVSDNSIVTCANPDTNHDYCGANPTCSSFTPCNEYQSCRNGRCIQTSCKNASDTLCEIAGEPQCINVQSNDAMNCGACNVACANKNQPNASSNACQDGNCIYTCDSGYTNCGTDTAPNCLLTANFNTDSMNCGGCGKKCAGDEYCSNQKCLKSTCSGNQCLSSGTCVNTTTQCGTSCKNCNDSDNAAQGTCNAGTCVSSKCKGGFHLNEGKCVANTETSCASVDSSDAKNCKTYNNATNGYCTSAGQCAATECASGYHLNGTQCEKDTTTACGSVNNNCEVGGWKTGKCENATCKATACKTNYCLSGTKCVDGRSNTSTCGITGGVCQSCQTHFSCNNGSCMRTGCEDNECFVSGSCSNGDSHCGGSCLNCNTEGNAKAGTCNTSTGVCTITQCQDGYHLYGNSCEPDSVNNCGAHDRSCFSIIPNLGSGTCEKGVCKASSCQGNYHPYTTSSSSTCEINSPTNCGSHGNTCQRANASASCTNGSCVYTCNSGYHAYNNTCEPDDATNCGSHGNRCYSPEQCLDKVCKCKDGYTTTTYDGTTYSAACISSVSDYVSFRDAINKKANWPTNNTQKAYYLTRDIVLPPIGASAGSSMSNPFTGKFFGNGKTITATAMCTDSSSCGLFGGASGALFSSLRYNVTISDTNSQNAGGLVGSSENSTYNNCSGTVTISSKATNGQVGGLIGCSDNDTITDGGMLGKLTCKPSSGTTVAGTIVGYASSSTIAEVSSSATISGQGGYYGGIVGSATSTNITSCAYMGSGSNSISAQGQCGGIVGLGDSNASISKSFVTGSINCGSPVGGIVGKLGDKTTITECTVLNTISGPAAGGIAGYVPTDVSTGSILNNAILSTLSANEAGGLVGTVSASSNLQLNVMCDYIAAKMSATNTFAVGAKGFYQRGPMFVWDDTYNHVQNTSYTNAQFKYYSAIAMIDSIKLSEALNKSSCGITWVDNHCAISTGPGTGSTLTTPIPGTYSPMYCSK